jgi:thioredoxin-like negative regulator of GroEL
MNRRLVPSVLFALALGAPLTASAQGNAIEWGQQDLDGVLAEAATCDAHVLVDVYASWCVPCQRLDAEVFPDSAVRQAAQGMLAVKVDAEVGAGPSIAQRYHVVGYPTVLVLDAQGNEIDRIFGYAPADEFAARLRRIRFGPATVTEFMEPFLRAASPETVLEEAYERGHRASACGRYDVAERLLSAVIAADADNTGGYASAAILSLGKYRYLRGAGEYDRAIGEFARLRERYPDSPEADEALIQTAIAHMHAGRPDSAIAAVRFYMRGAEQDAVRANNAAFTMLREGMDLAEAAAIARGALEAAPRDHSLWSTLAEVLYASGDREGALEAVGRALAIAPDSGYYARQRERFEAR